ncbi:flagellar hook-length control protein FliK [Georgenia satyanarayanai]|uniref:flagellar hook-length control protein FliK n=1 Tax=Georgenia satyanarayanai TaxID=860221 RepID=UPI00203C7651|nr:flagellar hook-length control protein FliK [Georgenia satyanarayanai]MCM3661959.1 flagellar hook-length control protein FliK [Georgenia satyanarayanai]
MSITIPTAPAPAPTAPGRPTAARSGSGDAFAASLAAATQPEDAASTQTPATETATAVAGEGTESGEGDGSATGTPLPVLELPAVPGWTVGTAQGDGADGAAAGPVPTTVPVPVPAVTTAPAAPAGSADPATAAAPLTAQVPAGRPAGPDEPAEPAEPPEPAPVPPRPADGATPAVSGAARLPAVAIVTEPEPSAGAAPVTPGPPAVVAAPAESVPTAASPAAPAVPTVGAPPVVTPPVAVEQPRTAPEAPTLAVEGTVRVDQPARTDGVTRAEQLAAPTPATPPQQPLGTQLASALSRLRTAPEGHHVLHVRVDPEDLGPVRVSAHIGADGVRIELQGMTDAAKDALRGALHDLRRELAATGLRADLDLGSENHQRGPAERPAPARDGARPVTTAAPAAAPTTPVRHGGLDLLA